MNNGICLRQGNYSALLGGPVRWAEPSPLFAPLHSTVKTGACTWGGTAVQAVVGSNVWAFHWLKKPRSRKTCARGYALHSVRAQLSLTIERAAHQKELL